MQFVFTNDDVEIAYEREFRPSSKAEIAHMLNERSRAIEESAFTTRMWHQELRNTERKVLAMRKLQL